MSSKVAPSSDTASRRVAWQTAAAAGASPVRRAEHGLSAATHKTTEAAAKTMRTITSLAHTGSGSFKAGGTPRKHTKHESETFFDLAQKAHRQRRTTQGALPGKAPSGRAATLSSSLFAAAAAGGKRSRGRRWWIIDPRISRCISVWDATSMLALMFTAIVTPFEVGFMDGPPASSRWSDDLFLLNRVVDLIFILDIVLQFCLGYSVASGGGKVRRRSLSAQSPIRACVGVWVRGCVRGDVRGGVRGGVLGGVRGGIRGGVRRWRAWVRACNDWGARARRARLSRPSADTRHIVLGV